MAAISLFWYTNMAAVTSDENDLYTSAKCTRESQKIAPIKLLAKAWHNGLKICIRNLCYSFKMFKNVVVQL
jgi:hypothetical protein